MEDSMPRPTRSKFNVRSEDARLRKSAAELTRQAKKFATKWDRISNDSRVAIERSTARSLRAASIQVNRTSKRMGAILEWLDRVRQTERAARTNAICASLRLQIELQQPSRCERKRSPKPLTVDKSQFHHLAMVGSTVPGLLRVYNLLPLFVIRPELLRYRLQRRVELHKCVFHRRVRVVARPARIPMWHRARRFVLFPESVIRPLVWIAR